MIVFNMGKHNIKVTILIIVLLLLLTAIGLLVTGYMHIGKELHEKQIQTMQLEREIDELDKYLTDYIVEGEEIEDNADVQRTAEDLKAAYERIAQLERRVRQLKNDNQASVEEIRMLEERIKVLKIKVYEKSKSNIVNITTFIDVLSQTIDSLHNDAFDPANEDPDNSNAPYIAEIKRLKGNIVQLKDQLKAISKIRANDIEFSNIKNGYKVEDRRHFKKSSMETLEVCFDIPGDKFAPLSNEAKDIYLIYSNPDGSLSLNTKGYSGRSKGENPFMYSAKTLFVRGRYTKQVCIEYRPQEYEVGVQKVQLRCEGCPDILGEKTFEISE